MAATIPFRFSGSRSVSGGSGNFPCLPFSQDLITLKWQPHAPSTHCPAGMHAAVLLQRTWWHGDAIKQDKCPQKYPTALVGSPHSFINARRKWTFPAGAVPRAEEPLKCFSCWLIPSRLLAFYQVYPCSPFWAKQMLLASLDRTERKRMM